LGFQKAQQNLPNISIFQSQTVGFSIQYPQHEKIDHFLVGASNKQKKTLQTIKFPKYLLSDYMPFSGLLLCKNRPLFDPQKIVKKDPSNFPSIEALDIDT
jgi:hypothetical protein